MNKRGFSLIETIISIALLNIILLFVFNFFTNTMKEDYITREMSKIDRHFNYNTKFLERNIQIQTNIKEIKGRVFKDEPSYDCMDMKDRVLLESVLLENKERKNISSTNDGFNMYVLENLNGKGKILKYNKNFSEYRKTESIRYIENIYVEPIPKGKTFKEALGIKLIFKNKILEREFIYNRSFFFKNKEGLWWIKAILF